jgi:hypothetical protein
MDYNAQQISALYDALPKTVLAVLGEPFDNDLADLAEKYKISPADLEEMRGEILLVILEIKKFETLEQTFLQKTSVGISNLKNICNDIAQNIINPLEAEKISAKNQDKEKILNEIENPVPTKPIVQNPAGNNPVLDAQHNLPEQEKKILISSAAVPSRGPILGNIKPSFASIPTTIPVAQVTPPAPEKPVTPTIQPVQPLPSQPISQPQQTTPPEPAQPQQPSQPQKPSQAPVPPAPDKYKVDPYREPAE